MINIVLNAFKNKLLGKRVLLLLRRDYILLTQQSLASATEKLQITAHTREWEVDMHIVMNCVYEAYSADEFWDIVLVRPSVCFSSRDVEGLEDIRS
jgi:hypothetical protein